MSIFTPYQQQLAQKLSNGKVTRSTWCDWRWQLKHAVRDIDSFEHLLGIRFTEERRKELEQTVSIFPLSVTPYYLSLIDRNNYEDDPVFRQAFPDPHELHIEQGDMSDPLAEDIDSPVAGITHG